MYNQDSTSKVYKEVKVLTGKNANDWASDYGDSAIYATKKSNGIETVRVLVVMENADTKYPGAGTDYQYAYMTSNSYKSKEGEDNDEVTVYEAWNGSENVTLKVDGTGTALSAGDLLIYTNDGDKFINVENGTSSVKVVKAAITGIEKVKEGNIGFTYVDNHTETYKMDEDCVFIAVNDDKQDGMDGSSMDQISLAEEVTENGTTSYIANAWIVYNNDTDKHIVAVIYDADNNHLDGNVKFAK